VLVPIIVGAIVGTWYAGRQPTAYLAQARLLLGPSQQDAAGHSLRDPQTEAYVATSTEVLRLAATAVHPAPTVAQLRVHLSVDSPSADLLDIRAAAASSSVARDLANAVARAYVAFSNNTNAAGLDSLQAQAAALQQRIGQLQEQIAAGQAGVGVLDPTSPDPTRSSTAFNQLQVEESQNEQALNGIEQRISNAMVGAAAQNGGARIVDPAVAPSGRLAPPRRRDAAGGALGGLVVGLALAMAAQHRDRRLSRRHEIARATGVPVIACLRLPRVGGLRIGGRHLLERWQPGPLERLTVRQALRHCDGDDRPVEHLVLVSPHGDRVAPLAALEMGVLLATMGMPTVVALPPEKRQSPRLPSLFRPDPTAEVRPGLRVQTGDELSLEQLSGAAVLISALIVDRSPLRVSTWSRRTVVSIAASAGGATARQLRSVVAACQEVGHEVRGVVLIDPEPDDTTYGRLDATAATYDPGRSAQPVSVGARGLHG
jgi:uncharacterized protein involved in exopolysaccharide biosynthesis